VTYRLESAD